MRVIVVGAGIAGLTAADAARCAGAEVLVVEGRDRIGGRTCTVPLGPGAIDLGGAWVHSPCPIATGRCRPRSCPAFGARLSQWGRNPSDSRSGSFRRTGAAEQALPLRGCCEQPPFVGDSLEMLRAAVLEDRKSVV